MITVFHFSAFPFQHQVDPIELFESLLLFTQTGKVFSGQKVRFESHHEYNNE